MKESLVACLALLAVAVGDDGSLAGPPKGDGNGRMGAAAAVAKVKAKVQPKVDKHLADEQTKVMDQLALGKRMPAMFKLPVRIKGVADPWGAMVELERSGLKVASAAGAGTAGIAAVLDRLSEAIGKPAGADFHVAPPKRNRLEDHIAYAVAIFDQAKKLRDEAVAKLKADDRKMMFSWPATLGSNFGPQLPLNEQTRPLLQNDRTFCAAAFAQYDWGKLVAAAQCLAELTKPAYVRQLERVLQHTPPITESIDGVTGELLFAKQTPHGWIIFGGRKTNTYKLTVPVALVVDLGGDDTYQGTVAASFDADHPHQVVIDLSGDDKYEGGQFSVGCGRVGVGMLLDLAGKDHYKLAPGSGGTGFGGIGVLCDAAGDDTYVGSKHTQAAAVAGIGLLLDLKGNDQHTSFGQAVGFAGPASVAALIDLSGNDSYQCGKKYPSGYNRSDNPSAKPGDPKFQYTAFGMGMGLGRRILSSKPEDHAYSLAGGLGMLLDLAGDDRYESSNFSQACGYFFGVGLQLDFAGKDQYKPARYGCASGAHFGMGLLVDYQGKDSYLSTGPTYNGGCSWDHSAFLFVEAGRDDDTYQWQNSAGPALADIGSWGVFAELGGNDSYQLSRGLGRASRTGLAVFFDQAGTDKYQLAGKPEDFTPADATTGSQNVGGLFVDE